MSKAIPHRYGFVTSALHFVLAAGLRCSDRQRQPSSDRPKSRARSGLPMWIASRVCDVLGQGKAVRDGFGAQRVTDSAAVGRIVWVRRSPLCGAGMGQSHHQEQ